MTTSGVDLRSAALLYAALGWPVLPLHTPDEFGACDCPKRADCESPGKHPRTRNGLMDATTDEHRIQRWWGIWPHANVGVDLARSGLVDVAPDSLEWFAEFTARGLPETLRFASGGGEGHAHHLYARPDGCNIHRACRGGEYDVLSDGYAVMPPSLHASQRRYQWLNPPDGIILTSASTPAPDWSVSLLGRARPSSTAPATEDDSPPITLHGEALERWYGRMCQRKPDGDVDRSYSLWWIAVVLLEAGLRRGFVEQCLAERDIALGWTKFSGRGDAARRYRVIVDRALAGRGPSRFRVAPATPTSAPSTTSRLALTFIDTAEIAELEDEDIVWCAAGMLGHGLITELDGKVKQSGKTTFLAAMVRAVINGEEFLEQPTIYAPVVYLTEQSTPSFKRNLRRAALFGHHDIRVLFHNRSRGMKWEDIVEVTREHCARTRAGILIVDTLAQFSGIVGDAENKSGSALEVMAPLLAAAGDGLAVLVSRHDRKSGGDVGDSGRGSSAYAGAVDIILHLQRVPGDHAGKERQRLIEGISRFEETPERLLVQLADAEPYEYRVIGDAEQVRTHRLHLDILALLSTDPAMAVDTKALREMLGVRNEDLAKELWALMKAGQVVRIGGGNKGDPHRYYQKGWDD